jgi:predicted ATPase
VAKQIAVDDGFPFLAATVSSVEAWALLAGGAPRAAITRGEEALEAQRATGARLSQPGYLLVLGYAHAFTGEVGRALELIESGLEVVGQTGQRVHAVGLWRARGELLAARRRGAHDEAEACHRRALDVARALDAPLLQLVAAAGYARYLIGAGRADQARATLAPVYEGFREGFETSALRDARAVLDAC